MAKKVWRRFWLEKEGQAPVYLVAIIAGLAIGLIALLTNKTTSPYAIQPLNSGPWQFTNRHPDNQFQVYFGEQNNQPKIEFQSSRGSLVLIPQVQAQNWEKETIEKKDVLKIKNAYPETDIIYQIKKNGLKEEVVLKKPGQHIFTFELDLKDLIYRKGSDGSWYFYKKSDNDFKNPVFYIPKPFMIDASSKRSEDVEIEIINPLKNEVFTAVLKASKGWLNDPKRVYPVTIDPTIELVILNVHSHPKAGDRWEVSFETTGTADLIITPIDQATISDLDFISLACDGQERTPQILENNVIFYPNWECTGKGKVVHLVKVAGTHTLKFQFGEQTKYAYNDPGWYNTNWSYRKKVTIDYTKVSGTGTLFSFPVLIDITDSNLATDAQDDGDDILFTSSNGVTKIDYEREYFNGTTGALVAWVEVPSLSGSSNTDIYMYYDNYEIADQQNANGTWNTNYKMILHFSETSGTHTDSTGNGRNASCYNGVGQGNSSGKIYRANYYDGDNDYCDVAHHADLNPGSGSFTVSTWVYNTAQDADFQYVVRKVDSWGVNSYWLRTQQSSNDMLAYTCDTGGDCVSRTFTSMVGAWHHYALTINQTTNKINYYRDGTALGEQDASAYGTMDTTNDFLIACRAGPAATLIGYIDEIRVSNAARSSDWIKTSYNNQDSPSTFYTVSTPTPVPPGPFRFEGLKIEGIKIN